MMKNRMEQLANKRTFAIVGVVLIVCSLLYFVIDNQQPSPSVSTKTFYSALSETKISITLPTDLQPEQCRLSMNESDNWFCESDSDWKRRKSIHHTQHRRNRVSNVRPLFFQNNWEPTIQCEFERRLGNTGDGGKWVCDIHRYGNSSITTILVYSLGSNGDFSFERAIQEQYPIAEIHTFDMGLFVCPVGLCKFHQVRIGNGKNDSSKSLQTIMKELGHEGKQIDVLKVDIEGSEFTFFEELFQPSSINQTNAPYIRQILFEIHLGGDPSDLPCRRTHQLFDLFRANNYAIFHKEANLYDPQNVFEYALLRLNPSFFVPPA